MDTTEELIKVEMQGGFSSQTEGLNWLCPQFTSRYNSYWCGTVYYLNGRYYMISSLCGDMSDLPVDSEPRPE